MLGVQWPYAATFVLAISPPTLTPDFFFPLRFCNALTEALCTAKCDAMPFKHYFIW